MPNLGGRLNGPWRPGSDEFNAEPGALLRADNLTRDEEGVLSLRLGTAQLSDVSDNTVTKAFSFKIDGSEKIVHVDDEALYVDGEVVEDLTITPGDTALAFVRGHMLIISGDNKYKYDGETLRNWGIEAPAAAPTVVAVDVATKTVANFTQASAEFTASEGTRSYVTGVDGVANAATGLQPAAGTGRGIMTYTFSAAQNLLDIQGNKGGDYDIFSIWIDDPQPEKFTFVDLDFGLSTGSDPFLTDYYHYRAGSTIEPIQLSTTEIAAASDSAKAAIPAPEDEVTPPGKEFKKDPDLIEARREDRRTRRGKENTE